jgi:photosystem II stability/assembly factor-like uncharacterized protein
MNKKYALIPVCLLLIFQACASPSPTPVSEPTETATLAIPTSTSTSTPTITPTSTPTPIPLAWTQIYDGQDFERDTITTFATDNTDPNVIYAGMKNSGVYKTVDGGLSWLPVNQGLVNMQIESLLIDSQNPSILYAGTFDGLFKTEDGGGNWFRVGEGNYLLMDTQDNSHLYARDENAIYETTDQGSTWEIVHPLKKDCPDAISSWAIHPADGKMLFIGGRETCAGVYQSSDSGHTWSFLGLKDKPNLNPLAIGLDEQGNFSVYANFDSSIVREERGIYVSHDRGTTWSQTLGKTLNGEDCEILISDPENLATIYCAGGRLYILQKRGEPWSYFPDTQNKVYTAVHIDHLNGTDRIIAGGTKLTLGKDTDVGIFISMDNGSSWAENNHGIGAARSELKIDSMNNARIYLATNYYGTSGAWRLGGCTLYRSMDSGKSWPSIKIVQWCGPSFDSTNVFYLMERNKLQQSRDGVNWLWNWCGPNKPKISDVKCIAHNRTLSVYELTSESQSISANPYMNNLIYAVGNTIYYSSEAGVPKQLSTGSEGSWDGRLFYTDQSKMIYAIGRYHQKYSTDNGITWQACGEDITTARSDSRLALDLQGLRLYLATPGRGVLVSTDKCRSWQESNNGLENLFVNTVAMDPNDNNILYAGTDGGAYVTFDGGGTWGQINDGLIGSDIVYSIAVDSESNVYAATPYGVFKLEGR